MSQRVSGYERIERDAYQTPEWATKCLIPHLRAIDGRVLESAAGSRKMVRALEAGGFDVVASDIADDDQVDFLKFEWVIGFQAIITNPPYDQAEEFINHALALMRDCSGQVAMLLRTDFDHAVSRKYLFSDNVCFAKKVVLTKRIRWIENSKGSPSFNHAWFIWDWRFCGPPAQLLYSHAGEI